MRKESLSAQVRHSSSRRLAVESLETRAMLTLLSVDVNDPGCTDVGPVYCQIQNAVEDATEGDKIHVASGTYDGTVVISVDGITLAGSKAGARPIIQGGVGVFANGVTVTGLESQNAPQFNFYVQGDNNTLKDNVARNGVAGFVLQGASHNTLINNESSGQFFGGFGLFNSHHNLLVGNTSSDNGSRLAGFFVGGNSNRLVNNTASGGFVGFFVEGNDNQLKSNTAIGNNLVGFNVFSSERTELQANRAINNADDGFRFTDSNYSVVTGNKSEGNGGYGYAVDAVMENLFEGNDCEGNALGGDNQDGAIC